MRLIEHDPLTRVRYKNISYIKIPKCASCSMQHAMKMKLPRVNHKQAVITYEVDDTEILFTVIRNPVDRWISGVLMYYTEFKVPELQDTILDDILLPSIRQGKLIFDCHTVPMVYYLYPFENKPIQLFKLNSLQNLPLELHIPNKNKSSIQKHNRIYTTISNCFNNSEFRTRFNQIYKDDITLFNDMKITYSGPTGYVNFDTELAQFISGNNASL